MTTPTNEDRLQQFSDYLNSPLCAHLTAWERHTMYARYALSPSLTDCPEPTPDELEFQPEAGYGKRVVTEFRERNEIR